MRITRSRGHVINLGSYESLRIEASVEFETTGDVLTSDDVGKAETLLDILLENEIREAVSLLPKGSDSYIQSWRVSA